VKLFLAVLGGRSRGCHIEQHDVRWVVGEQIEDGIPELIRQWHGLRKGLHLDSYRTIERVDGHRIEVVAERPTPVGATEPKLWFVNLGGYSPNTMAEQHQFDVVVARSAAAAKASAKRSWLRGLQQVHKDDLHDLRQDPALDDLLPITGNGQWSLRISPIKGGKDPDPVPDWFGYRLL